MSRLVDRFARHPETDRATELDPSTFAHPEEWQREPRDGRLAVASWLGAILISAPIRAGVIWGAIAILS